MPRTSPTFQSLRGEFRMRVVAIDAGLSHGHRRSRAGSSGRRSSPRHPRPAVFGSVRKREIALRSKASRSYLPRDGERIIGHELVAHGVVARRDQLAEFDRQVSPGSGCRPPRRDNCASASRSGARPDAADHVIGIEIPHVVDDAADLVGLPRQQIVRQRAHVEPDRERQAGEQRDHKQRDKGRAPVGGLVGLFGRIHGSESRKGASATLSDLSTGENGLRFGWFSNHQCQLFGGAGDAGIKPALAAVGKGEGFVEQDDVVPLRALRLVHGEHIAEIEFVIGLAVAASRNPRSRR